MKYKIKFFFLRIYYVYEDNIIFEEEFSSGHKNWMWGECDVSDGGLLFNGIVWVVGEVGKEKNLILIILLAWYLKVNIIIE